MIRLMIRSLAFLLAVSSGLPAQQPPTNPQRGNPSNRPGATTAERPPASTSTPHVLPEEKSVVTHGAVRVGGQNIPYTATAATYNVPGEDGAPKATFFFVAYTRDDVTDKTRRPLSFVYNGGPGSASSYTHMGLGPRRVVLTDDGFGMPAPYSIVENGDTFLDSTDLVFVDAISTGYSRPAPGEAGSQFYGVEQDAVWFANFILSLPHAQRTLGVAQVPDRRELWNHAFRAALLHAAKAPSDLSERRGPAFRCGLRQLGRRRPHHLLPPDLDLLRLVSQAAGAGPAKTLGR